MPLNLASPGILVREVDLTVGRVDPTSERMGAIVAPFAQGPVELPTIVENEQELLSVFGKPYGNDNHYEHWLVASSFLAYGGSLTVVRAGDGGLANAGMGTTGTNGAAAGNIAIGSSVIVKSVEHYEGLNYDSNGITGASVVAKDPGTWGNGLRIGIIDGFADQTLDLSASVTQVFSEVVSANDGDLGITTTSVTGITTTSIAVGQVVEPLPGIIDSGTTVESVGENQVTLNKATLNTVALDNVDLDFGTYSSSPISFPVVGATVKQTVVGRNKITSSGTVALDGYLKGVITGRDAATEEVYVKVVSHVSAAGVETEVDYQESGTWEFKAGTALNFSASAGTEPVATDVTSHTVSDWYSAQTLTLGSGLTVGWDEIAPRPGTSEYAAERSGRFDEVHVVVIDGDGKITGNAGTILEKNLNLSKAKDATYSSGSPAGYRTYLAANSAYVFGSNSPATEIAASTPTGVWALETDLNWNRDAENSHFGVVGNINATLSGGKNYGQKDDLTTEGALESGLDDLMTGYGLFENAENLEVDFLLMGSAAYTMESAQALAAKVIQVAETRKDAIAFISPHRGAALKDNPTATDDQVLKDSDITKNVIEFFAPLTSSSYAVFDTGYKYMYDRFANTFRYVPLNGDIAGTCARNDINNFPWFSPAGTVRGTILNAIKLAYNPSKVQRDKLYTNRINPVIFSPGAGIVLFGDKTGLAKASAFDRINVRRLFIFLEDAISAAAKDQLFEFNDEITRTNFVNIVEPFLRDVQAKRGIQDYVVICDETNNTAAVIDSNEFVADIYIKPARSINFIGLTFVATRTGVAFEEVIGNV